MGACASSPAAATTATSPSSARSHPSSKGGGHEAGDGGDTVAAKKVDNGASNDTGGGVITKPARVAATGSIVVTESLLRDSTKRTDNSAEKGPSTPTTISTDPSNEMGGEGLGGYHNRVPSQDASLGNFSTESSSNNSSSHSSIDDSNKSNGNNNLTTGKQQGKSDKKQQLDLSSSSHRRKNSRKLTKNDSKVGLTEIICGDLKNPNLVRIEVPLGKPIEEVYEGVHDGPVLGSGISGIVRLVKHRATQVGYAVKCLDLALIDSEQGLRQLKEEIYIMCQLDHPNIVRLEEVYESHSEIYLVQEVCKGGELFDRLDEQPDYHYTEAQCARLVKQMLSSVRYIHNKGIIHRDLKLENFLFCDLESTSELKMIDFGLSKHFGFGEVHHEAVGTPYTVAPEVIRGSYDERCDVWAIGVIAYLLLSGEPPFGGCGGPETLMQVRDNILRGAFEFEPAEIWASVSQEAKDFIKSLLVIDPMDRPTAKQAKESKWLKMWSNRENNGNGKDTKINPNVVKALVGFKEYSDMRKLLCEVLSFTLLPEQIQGLRQEFEKYDQEGTGEITLDTLKQVLIGNASTGSLGGLTEAEVVDIFNAIRVRKGETSIHWHDFIAAGLSQCQVDDRNLRLAFERLDAEHKGYITLDNVMDLMGNDTFENEDDIFACWAESMKDVNCKTALINYEEFVLLMKGQKRESIRENERKYSRSQEGLAGLGLGTLLEGFEEEADHPVHTPQGSINEKDSPSEILLDASTEIAVKKPTLIMKPKEASPTFVKMGSNSAPATPLNFGKLEEKIDQSSPIILGQSFNEDCAAFAMPDPNLTPPQTPVRGPTDYITPTVGRSTINPALLPNLAPPDLSLPGLPTIGPYKPPSTRGRSVSMDETRPRANSVEETDLLASKGEAKKRPIVFKGDSRRAMAIPEHTHTVSDIDRAIDDKSKTPLVVNRKLYRAHREFRHAVTEACKRFEDEQMRRAKETLKAREDASARHTYKSKLPAGLVMRHGQALSEQSIKCFLKKTLEEQQKKIDGANRRGGRGRRSRKKTISDMSGMMGGPALPQAAVDARKTVLVIKEEALEPAKENENLLRNPTKPGEFRKTNYDPFQRDFIFEQTRATFEKTPTSTAVHSTCMPMTGIPPPPQL